MDDHETSRFLDRLADSHDASSPDAKECPVGHALRAGARVYGARADRGGGRGPAQVASAEYRDHYDTIFGKTRVGEA